MEIDVRLTKIDNNIENLQSETAKISKMLDNIGEELVNQKLSCGRYRGEFDHKILKAVNEGEKNKDEIKIVSKNFEKVNKMLWALMVTLLATALGLIGTILNIRL